MTTILSISGGMLGLVSATLFALDYNSSALVFFMLALVVSAAAIFSHLNASRSNANIDERKILFNSALETIDARTRLTIDIVGNYRDTFKKYRYAINDEKRKFMEHLLSALGDIRINNEELKNTDLPDEERKVLIAKNRELLDRIENARPIIEQYMSENT